MFNAAASPAAIAPTASAAAPDRHYRLVEAEKPPAELAGNSIEAVDVALAGCRPGNEYVRPWAFKLRGIRLEAEGNALEALRCYDEAIRLGPKIGVERRADALRKALSK